MLFCIGSVAYRNSSDRKPFAKRALHKHSTCISSDWFGCGKCYNYTFYSRHYSALSFHKELSWVTLVSNCDITWYDIDWQIFFTLVFDPCQSKTAFTYPEENFHLLTVQNIDLSWVKSILCWGTWPICVYVPKSVFCKHVVGNSNFLITRVRWQVLKSNHVYFLIKPSESQLLIHLCFWK